MFSKLLKEKIFGYHKTLSVEQWIQERIQTSFNYYIKETILDIRRDKVFKGFMSEEKFYRLTKYMLDYPTRTNFYYPDLEPDLQLFLLTQCFNRGIKGLRFDRNLSCFTLISAQNAIFGFRMTRGSMVNSIRFH